ncbi:MAG: hypothetical protein M1834_005773 [Cirrosporium novae-zelandiae]|nr:MAG: hypothetical protein M1834_005773 [Cirrosporium novae-zelandiae]
MVNWKAADSYDRLIAAAVACNSVTDYRTIAHFYGRDATYNAIEAQFRKFRRTAETLKSEAASRGNTATPGAASATPTGASSPVTPTPKRGRPVGSTSGSGRKKATTTPKATTPAASKDGVLSGRVSKPSTPTKPRGKANASAAAAKGNESKDSKDTAVKMKAEGSDADKDEDEKTSGWLGPDRETKKQRTKKTKTKDKDS